MVEHLTKQNHDLEEQLQQRDAGPNSHREKQEGTSTERRDREGLEGSNAPSRQERQDTSRLSIMKTAPPHMVAKMQMMKKMMDFMMNTFKGWVSSDLDKLVHRTNSPFIAPRHFIPPSTEFLYAIGKSLRQVKGSLRSPRVIQNPHALARRGGRNHVSSLPDYAEGSCKGMVQQADAQLHQYL